MSSTVYPLRHLWPNSIPPVCIALCPALNLYDRANTKHYRMAYGEQKRSCSSAADTVR